MADDSTVSRDPFTARSREHYVEAWQRHVNELAPLFLAAHTDYGDYNNIHAQLFALIERAADRLYK